ncbi:hypothetical protein R9X49_21940 [Pectobacterium carotovorum]|uniref:hypothetical protein n=1 Tax=Pectobacterium carotovorum TaxID=554 RepID=UPI0029D47B16|nr:hypothetical protein [Pectobacterium carotovorum]MDX6917760.1 hypothetical protein [Pectobacterium carotovorum]
MKLTLITLENGDYALYVNESFVECEDYCCSPAGLGAIAEGLARALKIELDVVEAPWPAHDDWCWNDVADGAFSKEPLL